MKKKLLEYHRALRRHYGPLDWWPGDTPFEVMVGAILTQNTAWANVEKAMRNLKSAKLLTPRRIAATDLRTLAAAVRPSGYYRQKSKRLKGFASWIVEAYGGDIGRMKKVPHDRMREELLAVKGVGPETADSILLYALGQPSFVIDTYTYRVLTRHEIVPEESTYDEMKDLFETHLNPDIALYNEFHAQFVMVGKDHCGPKARCEGCPLERLLP